MLKNFIAASLVLGTLFNTPAYAAAPVQPREDEEPLDTIYCIKDFYTGDLLCLSVPDPGPVIA